MERGFDEDLAFLGWIALTLGSNPLVPYVPTRPELIPRILELLELREDDVFYDLGCGDGRVVIEAVKKTRVKKAVCVETREDLLKEARMKAEEEGVADRIEFVNNDFFKTPLKDATAVYMYLLTSVNESLKPKLARELREGARIVTLDFPIPGWKPVKVETATTGWQRSLYLYVKGVSDRG
ncbi:SAM-dependent methyltransferase [Aeropyrum camini SY1 = JCM 12091]|uniref:SAM-dependent methyltransferase n=1 Tax=Aeropyrum camini SY1 = JCM 12091 TaxID=1198449 RepID=U3TGF1_9CREN|nr:SAM-dependent methyltransferase [Aeropyrum camini SY1 = JCM 12091]